jgi:rRNA-processing protein EBP2
LSSGAATLQALDAHKGRDFDAEKQKKLIKAAEKKKAKKATDHCWFVLKYKEKIVFYV